MARSGLVEWVAELREGSSFGSEYPAPIIDFRTSRHDALDKHKKWPRQVSGAYKNIADLAILAAHERLLMESTGW